MLVIVEVRASPSLPGVVQLNLLRIIGERDGIKTGRAVVGDAAPGIEKSSTLLSFRRSARENR